MTKREEIAALKAEIARLNARIFTLESQRLAAPIVYHVPVPVPTSTRAPWDPPWIVYSAVSTTAGSISRG